MSEPSKLASQIGKASAIIIIWSILDKILAIGKEMLTAHRFGVSTSLDIFNVAQMFPGIVGLLFSGAIVTAFVPIYLEWTSQSSACEADSHATWLIYLSTLFFMGLALISFFFAPEIINLVGYGFQSQEQKAAVAMERLLILLIVIEGVGFFFRGVLHAKKLFTHLYVAPLFLNIIIIFLLLFDLGLDIYALVWGFLIGTLLKTAYMIFAAHREGFRCGTPLPFDHQKMKIFGLLALPVLGSSLIANSNLMIDQMMATDLPAGSVSTLRYAIRINDLPIHVVVTAVSMAIFPFISEEAAAGNRENLRKIFKYALIFLGFLTIPITCLVMLFSEDLVVLLLKRGAFDAEAAALTAQTLVFYSLGLFFYGYTFLNGNFFVVLKNAKVLLYMGIVSILLDIFFNLVFMRVIGVRGIALSTSVTMCIISIWFIFLLKRRLDISNLGEIFSSFYRILLAAACMLGTGFLFLELFQMVTTERWIYVPVTLVLVCIAYLGVLWKFRTEDLDACWNAMTRMLRGAFSSIRSS